MASVRMAGPASHREGSDQVDIGKIERVALREVWPRETHDCATWLRDNLDILGDTIALELTGGDSEQAAGDFSVDILAELPQLPHLGFHLRISPAVALFLETLKDPFRRVPLLFGHSLVLLEDLLDTAKIGAQLGLSTRLTLAVTWWLWVFKNLLQRRPMDARLPQNPALAHPLA